MLLLKLALLCGWMCQVSAYSHPSVFRTPKCLRVSLLSFKVGDAERQGTPSTPLRPLILAPSHSLTFPSHLDVLTWVFGLHPTPPHPVRSISITRPECNQDTLRAQDASELSIKKKKKKRRKPTGKLRRRRRAEFKLEGWHS